MFRTHKFNTRTLRVITIENRFYRFFGKITVVVVPYHLVQGVSWTSEKDENSSVFCRVIMFVMFIHVLHITLNLSSSLFDFIRGNKTCIVATHILQELALRFGSLLFWFLVNSRFF